MAKEKQKILITGSTGMLGKDVVNELVTCGEYAVYGIARKDFIPKNIEQIAADITDIVKLSKLLEKIDPDTIIHCAANTDVENCERNKDYTCALHVDATRALSSYKPDKVKMIYISTDSVFDGQKGGYSENDAVNPMNYYAVTKYEGELVVAETRENYLILRTNIYGYHVPYKNSLVEWAVKNWKENKGIKGYGDIYFNPLYTKQLARLIVKLMKERRSKGILNVGSENKITKYEFLLRLARELGYDQGLIIKTSIEEIDYIAKRPKNTTLDINKARSIIGNIPDLYDGIKELGEDLGRICYGKH